MIDSAIAGGVEAPITDFTLAQMLALKIYTPYDTYPFSRPFELYPNHNSFVLGEGAGLFRLGTQRLKGGNNQFEIIGYGVGYENAESLVAISKDGDALAKAMQSAVKQAGVMPDLICAHAPGTILGDQSESRAIKTIFSDNLPYVFSTKFLFGHTLGSSGALSLAYACKLLETQKIIPFPYKTIWGEQNVPKDIKTILVNATGFGGTAVSLMISRVQD
jgi:3-oxoacyl-(acyl-carrier-protein) synthase